MAIEEISSQGWGSRLMDSIKGVLVGLLLTVGSIAGLWWNEGRAVTTQRSLEEGLGVVISVAEDTVDAANEGKLVHLSADATTQEVLTDSQFGVSAQALRLRRDVEMYQWEEVVEKETRKKVGGGTETVTNYEYELGWFDEHISSAGFREPSGHQNPPAMPVDEGSWNAKEVTLGAFEMSQSLLSRMRDWVTVDVPAPTQSEMFGMNVTATGDGYYLGASPASPQVGDVRVSFGQVMPALVSVVAQQAGSSFRAYPTKAGKPIEMLRQGFVPAESMFAMALEDNRKLTWMIRGLGFVMMAIGIGMIFQPLVVMADVLPFLGSLLGMGIAVFSGLMAAAISGVTIGIAWVAVRPLLGGGLIAAGLAAVIVPKLIKR